MRLITVQWNVCSGPWFGGAATYCCGLVVTLAAMCGLRWAMRVQGSSHDGIRLLMNVWRSIQWLGVIFRSEGRQSSLSLRSAPTSASKMLCRTKSLSRSSRRAACSLPIIHARGNRPSTVVVDHPCLRGLLGTTFDWNVGFQWLAARALLGRSRSAVRRGRRLEIRSLLQGLDECRSGHIFFALLRRFAGRRWRYRRAGELSVTPRCRRRPRNGSWCLCKQCRLLLYPSLHPAVLPESEILASSLGRLWRSSKRFCIRPRLSRNCPHFPSEVSPPIE